MIQVTLAALAAVAVKLAYSSWKTYAEAGGSSRLGSLLFLALAGAGCIASALWMGIRTVRGPQPPVL